MRVINNIKCTVDNESAASSLDSNGSYGLFGSGCSDLSESEYDDKYTEHAEQNSKDICRMKHDEIEKRPLIVNHVTMNGYKTIGPGPDLPVPSDILGSGVFATLKRSSNKGEEKNKQSSLVTIFSVWNTIMGSSLLTMAWGIERAGLPAALALLVLMSALCLYTAYLLIEVNRTHGGSRCEVPALCRALLGRHVAALAHLFSLLVLSGACAVYWVLITNFLYFTVNNLIDISWSNGTVYNTSLLCPRHGAVDAAGGPVAADPSGYWALHSTVPLYVAIILFPLLNFTNVSFFTRFNSLGTLSVMYLLVFVVVKGSVWGVNVSSLPAPHLGKDAAVLSGMLALSFYIHNIIITIMSNNQRQEKNGRDLSIAFLLVTLTYILVGIIFYICFPLAKSCIEDNLLNNFEMHDAMTALARAVLLFQVITVFPLVAYMLRSEAIMLLPVKNNRCTVVTVNLIIVTLCILVACFCPTIGTIIRYTGAASGLVHVFALPAMMHMRAQHMRRQLTVRSALAHSAIILFGTVNLLMQFFID